MIALNAFFLPKKKQNLQIYANITLPINDRTRVPDENIFQLFFFSFFILMIMGVVAAAVDDDVLNVVAVFVVVVVVCFGC